MVLITLPHERQLAVSTLIRSTLLSPVLQLRNGLSDLRSMRTRVQRLRAERDTLTARLLQLQGVGEINSGLRALLNLSDRAVSGFHPANLYPAGRAGEAIRRSFVLDLGAVGGVQTDDAVVAAGGLVGVVRAVAANQSTGDFWTHPDFRVSAMTADAEVFGIIRSVEGGSPLMQLDGAPYQVELAAGTQLVTSGLGGVFPRGIPIGQVAKLTSTEEGWARSYLVRPAIYPDAAREVMVLIDNGEDAVDVTEVWRHAASGDPP